MGPRLHIQTATILRIVLQIICNLHHEIVILPLKHMPRPFLGSCILVPTTELLEMNSCFAQHYEIFTEQRSQYFDGRLMKEQPSNFRVMTVDVKSNYRISRESLLRGNIKFWT